MCKKNQEKSLHNPPSPLSGWETAICDTEGEIKKTRRRLIELEAALKVFKERRASGEAFPGESQDQDRATWLYRLFGQEPNLPEK